jgi:hypothetical protein
VVVWVARLESMPLMVAALCQGEVVVLEEAVAQVEGEEGHSAVVEI